MEASIDAVAAAAAFTAFWALLLGVLVALRLHAERGRFRLRRRS
jgi:hypothetical protein